MPSYHITKSPFDNNIKSYVNGSNSILTITSVPTKNMVQFPAFLTDFSQTFDATWNTEDVFGRMDPIATYQSTKRTMSLGFDVPAGNLEQAKWNLETCSLLTTMVYPVYNNIAGSQVLSKPPLVRIQFANLIQTSVKVGSVKVTGKGGTETEEQRLSKIKANKADTADWYLGNETNSTKPVIDPTGGLLGWISGLSWKPNLEMGMFTESMQLYPKIISISFSFNILHEKVLDQATISNSKWPFGD